MMIPAVAANESWNPGFQMTLGSGKMMRSSATPKLLSVLAGFPNSVPICGMANIMTARRTAGEPPVTGT